MTVQLAFDLDAAQAARNGACAPPARAGRPCARCKALGASPTAPDAGTICTSCRLAAGRAQRRCAQCAGPIPPGKKSTTRYCSRPCKDRADVARAAERDHGAGVPLERRRCECDRPLLILDDALAETRCMRCGRVR